MRFGQYLVERGYVKLAEAPKLVQVFSGKAEVGACLLLQARLAEKLGVPPAGPMPKSLAFLADPEALQKWNTLAACFSTAMSCCNTACGAADWMSGRQANGSNCFPVCGPAQS